MGAETLSSRAIIGRFYRTLEQDVGAAWIEGTSMLFDSNQPSEEYKWLGQVPAMREWIGGRQAKGFLENGITIANKHYEATLEFLLRELRRDKTNQINVRIDEFAQRTNSHWGSLLSTLIINGESTACYDGQFFFDTDHSEGDSGSQSNDLSVDISALPCAVHGSTTAPSLEEMAAAILQAVQTILGFKDDRGQPMNEMARKFTVMVPVPLFNIAVGAVHLPFFGTGISNLIPNAKNKFEIEVEMNARLTWTDKFSVFRTDGSAKPLIRQQETPVQLKAKAEGSEFEFDNDAWQFGVDTWRNVGYGFWQHACLVTMI
jgi:phage major head subunit gpT-like protein